MKTDRVKKYILKMNTKLLGLYCNHKVSDGKCDMIFSNATDMYNSKEFTGYKEFIKNLSQWVWGMRYRDTGMKKCKD